MNPSVTVIMPTYNWSSVLPYSIGSVLRQSFTDFELLVVGDGCTDDSERVVRQVGDSRVKWINLPINTGHQSEPNNEGLSQARGQYIAYLGHDDLWLPHHLSCLVPRLKEGATMAYGICLVVRADGHGTRIAPTRKKYHPGMGIPPTNVVHRRSVTDHIGGWRRYRELDLHPDVELWQRAYNAGYKFVFVPRLTAIKFPAVARRDVYKTCPCHEQAAWSERIQNEADFEGVELVNRIVAMAARNLTKPYRTVLYEFLQETLSRVRRQVRGVMPRLSRSKGDAVETGRRFKGLHPMP